MRNADGISTGVEVSTTLLSRSRACRIAGRVPGARIIRKPRLFHSRREDFCTFELEGVLFVIIEPFGDNAVYWVVAGEPSAAAAPLIERVWATFAAALG